MKKQYISPVVKVSQSANAALLAGSNNIQQNPTGNGGLINVNKSTMQTGNPWSNAAGKHTAWDELEEM